MVQFVFRIALPSLIVKGLGTNIDFYEESNLWYFIGSFLIHRFIALVMSVMIHLVSGPKGIGYVSIYWLCLSWVSTVILGVPILAAVFNDNTLGLKHGILAGITSFIFQLPLQLLFMELHIINDDDTALDDQHTEDEVNDDTSSLAESLSRSSNVSQNNDNQEFNDNQDTPRSTGLNVLQQRDIYLRVGGKLLQNPILWGIVIGFVFSLSTFGAYLKSHEDYGKWILSTLSWFGTCVSPLSLFTMGVWMSSQPICNVPATISAFCLISKLLIMPLAMGGVASLMHLNDIERKAAILISALPISMASFSLGSRYKIGEKMLSENVVLGTLLLLPTVFLWNALIDYKHSFSK